VTLRAFGSGRDASRVDPGGRVHQLDRLAQADRSWSIAAPLLSSSVSLNGLPGPTFSVRVSSYSGRTSTGYRGNGLDGLAQRGTFGLGS
jgi:hypothetical protein